MKKRGEGDSRGHSRIPLAVGCLLIVMSLPGLGIHAVDALGVHPSISVAGPWLVTPGFALYTLGVREPFVESGGGLAWVSILGLLAFGTCPGTALLLWGIWRRKHRSPDNRSGALKVRGGLYLALAVALIVAAPLLGLEVSLRMLRVEQARRFFEAEPHMRLARELCDRGERLAAFYLLEDARRRLVEPGAFREGFARFFLGEPPFDNGPEREKALRAAVYSPIAPRATPRLTQARQNPGSSVSAISSREMAFCGSPCAV